MEHKETILIHTYSPQLGAHGYRFEQFKMCFEYLGYKVILNHEGFDFGCKTIKQDIIEHKPIVFIFIEDFMHFFDVKWVIEYKKNNPLQVAAIWPPYDNPKNNEKFDVYSCSSEYLQSGLLDLILTVYVPCEYRDEIYKGYGLPVKYFGASFNHLLIPSIFRLINIVNTDNERALGKRVDLVLTAKRVPGKDDFTLRLRQVAKEKGWTFDIYGTGWPYDTISYEQYLACYTSAKISPNIHNLSQIANGIDVNARSLEAFGMGCFSICDNMPGARYFFTSDELPIAKTFDEYIDLIDFFLKNDIERNKYALRGYKRVLEQYTTLQLCKDFLQAINKG